MFRFAYSLASKVWSVDIRPSKNNGLSLSRNYASQVLHLGLQDKLSQNSEFLHLNGQEFFLPGVSTSSLQQVENPACHMDENGTKYFSVMRQALCFGGRKAVEAGVNLKDLDNGIQLAFEAVKKHLHCRARTVSSKKEIFQIGMTAANGDHKIGELIAETYEKIQGDGFYIIDIHKEDPIYPEALIGRGTAHAFQRELEAAIADFRKAIHLNPSIGEAWKWRGKTRATMGDFVKKRPLLIVAEDIDKHVAASIILDRMCQYTKVCVIIPPEFKENIETTKYDLENKKGIMRDLAILTGGPVVTGASSLAFIPQMLGSCKEVTLSCDDMAIHGGRGHLDDIKIRGKQLRSAIESSSSDYEINLLTERYDKLCSGAAIFKVGKSKKAKVRVTNALTAFKAALEEGIVPGGGIALFHASKELDQLQTISSDEKIGVKLLQHALKMPVYTIASTLGFEGSAVVEKLMELENPDLGYDLVRGEYFDVVKSGVVDPLKLVRNELEDVIRHFVSHSWCSSEVVASSEGT